MESTGSFAPARETSHYLLIFAPSTRGLHALPSSIVNYARDSSVVESGAGERMTHSQEGMARSQECSRLVARASAARDAHTGESAPIECNSIVMSTANTPHTATRRTTVIPKSLSHGREIVCWIISHPAAPRLISPTVASCNVRRINAAFLRYSVRPSNRRRLFWLNAIRVREGYAIVQTRRMKGARRQSGVYRFENVILVLYSVDTRKCSDD